MAISQKLQKKIDRIFVYTEAMEKVENILKPLWSEYINGKDIVRKKKLWSKIEKFEQISNNLNDKYLKSI